MTTIAFQKRNYKKAIRHYVMLLLIVLAGVIGFGYKQYEKLTAAQDALVQEEEMLGNMQTTVETFGNQYTELKKNYDDTFIGILGALQSVLPPAENYTGLARLFDQFYQKNNAVANPFFISDLKFGIARPDAGKDFTVLPVTMTISSSKDNFMKFLKYIGNSGMLESKVRLMDVRSISINFISPSFSGYAVAAQYPAAQELWNVSLVLNAYFQKTAEKTPAKK